MRILIMIIIFITGCAAGVTGLLRLQDRELLIHPDKTGLSYPHNITTCKKRRFLPDKCKTTHKIDFYDFNNKEERMKLIHAGFTCKSKMRFKY